MQYVWAFIVFIAQETIGLIVFPIMNHYLGPEDGKAWDRTAIFKGILERLVLYTALIHGYPHMLIAIGAMKLGTRLHADKESDISNTYFLVGSLLSILLVIISSVVIKTIWQE